MAKRDRAVQHAVHDNGPRSSPACGMKGLDWGDVTTTVEEVDCPDCLKKIPKVRTEGGEGRGGDEDLWVAHHSAASGGGDQLCTACGCEGADEFHADSMENVTCAECQDVLLATAQATLTAMKTPAWKGSKLPELDTGD